MTEPEKIWAVTGYIGPQDMRGEWATDPAKILGGVTEYTRTELYQAAIAREQALQAQVVGLEAALVAAYEMRKAADRVSEWFYTEASHLEGPRIQALRACMLAYDRQMWLFPSTTLSQGNGE